jgi:hypothetical protein
MCDFVDLDGPLLIRNNPFDGVHYAGARLILPGLPGLGVKFVKNNNEFPIENPEHNYG